MRLLEQADFNGTQREYDAINFDTLRAQILSGSPPNLFRILTGDDLKQLGAAPADRTPNFVVIPTDGTNGTKGVVYAKKDATKVAEHGGISDADLRVPLVISGPGIALGVTSNDLVLTLSVGPTLAKLMGLSLPNATAPVLLTVALAAAPTTQTPPQAQSTGGLPIFFTRRLGDG